MENKNTYTDMLVYGYHHCAALYWSPLFGGYTKPSRWEEIFNFNCGALYSVTK